MTEILQHRPVAPSMLITPTPRADWLAGLALLLAIGFITTGPVAYVVVESFDVAPLGAPFRFGLNGWRDVFASQRTLNSIVYSFVLAARVPIAIGMALGISWLIIRIDIPGKRFIELALLF